VTLDIIAVVLIALGFVALFATSIGVGLTYWLVEKWGDWYWRR